MSVVKYTCRRVEAFTIQSPIIGIFWKGFTVTTVAKKAPGGLATSVGDPSPHQVRSCKPEIVVMTTKNKECSSSELFRFLFEEL